MRLGAGSGAPTPREEEGGGEEDEEEEEEEADKTRACARSKSRSPKSFSRWDAGRLGDDGRFEGEGRSEEDKGWLEEDKGRSEEGKARSEDSPVPVDDSTSLAVCGLTLGDKDADGGGEDRGGMGDAIPLPIAPVDPEPLQFREDSPLRLRPAVGVEIAVALSVEVALPVEVELPVSGIMDGEETPARTLSACITMLLVVEMLLLSLSRIRGPRGR